MPVLQVDVGPHNVLLDWDENAKLSEFAGSSINGSKPLVAPSEHSEHPDFPAATPSVQSEMFALGSTLYEVETTRQPYHDRAEKEIQELFHVWSFPDTSALVLGEVITKCWRLEYQSVGEVVENLERIRKRLGITEKGEGK
ncbi:hypothetical protein SLS56_001193 [Neofusicoccum ribis]|uniref:Protein kinase domain-containing protein n=1 Tax=Neofusicoccum ribis TaxID=45134 RepID=A0ABR3T9J1_9PEZI